MWWLTFSTTPSIFVPIVNPSLSVFEVPLLLLLTDLAISFPLALLLLQAVPVVKTRRTGSTTFTLHIIQALCVLLVQILSGRKYTITAKLEGKSKLGVGNMEKYIYPDFSQKSWFSHNSRKLKRSSYRKGRIEQYMRTICFLFNFDQLWQA